MPIFLKPPAPAGHAPDAAASGATESRTTIHNNSGARSQQGPDYSASNQRLHNRGALLLHNDRGGTGAAGGYGIGSTKPVNAILARLARGSNHAGVVAPSAAVAIRVGDGDVRHVSGGGCASGGLLLR